MKDVWGFMLANYPIRPEREAHILMGASMGGFSAYNLGIKYRECFKIVAAIFPPLNLRYVDCHGKYRTNFDPCCWGWRKEVRPCEVMARFYCVVTVRMKQLIYPLYGRDREEALTMITKENPIEMLETFDVQPGQLDLYVGYGGKDQFNLDAQVESFLYVAKQRGLCVTVGYDPKGRHDLETGLRLFPGAARWLAPLIAPYAPPAHCPAAIVPGP
jgi:S-formylglutathione hydrolase FrmB